MKIEVTEKEAMEIYCQRYHDSKGKAIYLPLCVIAIALIISLFVMNNINQWLGVGALVILSSPAIYMSLKSGRASRQYAKKLIEEAK